MIRRVVGYGASISNFSSNSNSSTTSAASARKSLPFNRALNRDVESRFGIIDHCSSNHNDIHDDCDDNRHNRASSNKHNRANSKHTVNSTIYRIVFIIVALTIVLLVRRVEFSVDRLLIHSRSSTGGIILPFVATTTITEEAASSMSTTSSSSVESMRQRFYARYGGSTLATQLYQKGIVAAQGSLQATVARILQCAATQTPFVLSFAGYSVTVGRGNHFHQSFPFVLERILQPLFQNAPLKIDLHVRNAAIGGIPSFPYGFCFENFLGMDSQVISWDYGMNEGNTAAILESYIRHAQAQLWRTRPMIIVLDSNKARCQLLQQYAGLGLVKDAVCVKMPKDVVDIEKVTSSGNYSWNYRHHHQQQQQQQHGNETIPPGFQDWDQFGAPPTCPGRGSWHPKRQEHELLGWMLAMYFVSAVEIAISTIAETPDWKTTYRDASSSISTTTTATITSTPPIFFPKPLSRQLPANSESVSRLLYGHPALLMHSNNSNNYTAKQQQQQQDYYQLHRLSCRTSFLPTMNQDKTLPSIVAAGLAHHYHSSEDILEKRSDHEYQRGWVLDVSAVERKTKIKVNRCGGLGYIDTKIALYGIPESGVLRLWLPVNSYTNNESLSSLETKVESHLASDSVQELVICEANEKRSDKACQLDHDLSYTIGGARVENTVKMITEAAEYMKRGTCVHIGIPENAKLTKIDQVRDINGYNLTDDAKQRLTSNFKSSIELGLEIDVRVIGSVNRMNGACCISHIVWEHTSM